MEFFKATIIPAEVFVQLLAFIIVFWTLKLLAWKPLLALLENRRSKIQSELDGIEKAKREIETLKADYAKHLQTIDEEARTKIQHAVEEGRKIAKDIQEKARGEAQQAFDKSKENLSVEIAKARLELKQDIANLVIQVSEKVIREKLNEAKQQDKIAELIKDLETSWKNPDVRP